MIQGIVFDMDGVLADTEHFYQCRREEYLERMDFPGPRGVDFVGSNEKAIWETLVPDDPKLREQMLQGYRAYRRFHPEDYRKLVDPEVKPLFGELHRRNIRVAIASSSDRDAIRRFIQAANVMDLVDYVISGEECSAHKPDPEIYLRAMEALGLTPETAFAVEDSPTGIAAARNAGMTVYALHPRHSEKMDQSAANAILNSLAEVIEKL